MRYRATEVAWEIEGDYGKLPQKPILTLILALILKPNPAKLQVQSGVSSLSIAAC